MTNDEPPDGGNPAGTSGGGWDAIKVLETRASAASARRDVSIAELRKVMEDDEILTEFGIDLTRLKG